SALRRTSDTALGVVRAGEVDFVARHRLQSAAVELMLLSRRPVGEQVAPLLDEVHGPDHRDCLVLERQSHGRRNVVLGSRGKDRKSTRLNSSHVKISY